MRLRFIFLISLLIPFELTGQNTVGTIFFDPDSSSKGYNLFYPNHQENVFLVDGCGRLINTWTDNEQARPGTVVHLLADGSLLRAKTDPNFQPSTFGAGGAGGTLEIVDWDSKVIWRMIIADSIKRSHHDVHPMPNGDILAIVWEKKNLAEIVTVGFDTTTYPQTEIWSDAIYQIDTHTNEIVWSWHAWDHLIQDFDAMKVNFGSISDNPQRININYQEYTFTRSDWIHMNSLDYNEELDQIVVSSKTFNEVWIIDHSTTQSEAGGSSGGLSGKGGDLLFRWGNPEAYEMGSESDRILFQPHDAHWMTDEVSADHPWRNKIILFNNFIIKDQLSLGQILSPQFDTISRTYDQENGMFLPFGTSKNFYHPDTVLGYSASASSIQLLQNGNVLMCAAQPGRFFETTQDHELVWEYRTPFIFGEAIPQGTIVSLSANYTNQVTRYSLDHPAFLGKDVIPKGYLEINPNEEFCEISTSVRPIFAKGETMKLYPNPASSQITIGTSFLKDTNFEIYNWLGITMQRGVFTKSNLLPVVDVSTFQNGLYFLSIDGFQKTVKFLVINE